LRKTILCLISCLVMYFAYMYTLPGGSVPAEIAPAAAQPRISARISLPAVRLYAVSLGSFDTQSEALPYAAAYSARGAAGCIVETDSGWELLGAMCETDGEAESVCRRLDADEAISAHVVFFSAEGMDISLSAAQSQADAIKRALELMNDIPGELSALAAQVDSGMCTPDTARSLAAIRNTEAGRTLETLSSELGATADIFSRMTETGLTELHASLGVICAEDGPGGLMLSSLMKQCAIETRLYMYNMLITLSR